MGRGQSESVEMRHQPIAPRTVRTLERLLERDGAGCVWCSRPLSLDRAHGGVPTREHLMPQVAGGADSLDNLVVACGPCNGARKTVPFIAYARDASVRGKQVRVDVLDSALSRMLSSDDESLAFAAAVECSRLLDPLSVDGLIAEIRRRVGSWRSPVSLPETAAEVVALRQRSQAQLEQIRAAIVPFVQLEPAEFSRQLRQMLKGEKQVVGFMLSQGKEVEALHRLERQLVPFND